MQCSNQLSYATSYNQCGHGFPISTKDVKRRMCGNAIELMRHPSGDQPKAEKVQKNTRTGASIPLCRKKTRAAGTRAIKRKKEKVRSPPWADVSSPFHCSADPRNHAHFVRRCGAGKICCFVFCNLEPVIWTFVLCALSFTTWNSETVTCRLELGTLLCPLDLVPHPPSLVLASASRHRACFRE